MYFFNCFVVIVFVLMTGCAPEKAKPDPYPNDKSAAPAVRADTPAVVHPAISISATDLTAAYVANEVKADNDFKGKTVSVTGIVQDIKKGLGDNIFVVLTGSEKYRAVQCYFNNEKEAEQLSKGMKVTFKGTCDGLMANVIMLDCALVNKQ